MFTLQKLQADKKEMSDTIQKLLDLQQDLYDCKMQDKFQEVGSAIAAFEKKLEKLDKMIEAIKNN